MAPDFKPVGVYTPPAVIRPIQPIQYSCCYSINARHRPSAAAPPSNIVDFFCVECISTASKPLTHQYVTPSTSNFFPSDVLKARTERRDWTEMNWTEPIDKVYFLTNCPIGEHGKPIGHWLTRAPPNSRTINAVRRCLL